MTNKMDAKAIDGMKGKQKSGLLAAGLNLLLPGVGYMYCGMWVIGIIALPFVFFMVFGQAALQEMLGQPVDTTFIVIPIWIILIIDGFLAANRYNKKLDKKINDAMKTCPQCAEKILPAAKVCKHCGNKLEQQQ